MKKPTSKTTTTPSGNSNDAITASLELAKVFVDVGAMVPLVGGFFRGLGGVAVGFLTTLELYQKNKEDVEDLAKDIIDILIIVRDACIKISAVPEGVTYIEDLRKACLEFQEFLSNLTTQVLDIDRSRRGPWKGIRQFITSRNVKEEIDGHRQAMETAKSNLMLSLTLKSNASISQINHGISSLQTSQTDLMTVTHDIQRDVSHIRANTRNLLVNNKFHSLRYGDIQLREIWTKNNFRELYTRRKGEVVTFVADVSTSNRVMVVKEYSGDLGLVEWKKQLDIHSVAKRHPNLRQLYGVVQSGSTPCLVFHGNADEMTFTEFPKLFDKRLEPLAYCLLAYRFHRALIFSLTHLQVLFDFESVRCTTDGRLLFDEQVDDLRIKRHINSLADKFRPLSPEIQGSLDSFVRRLQAPLIVKEHLLSYYDVIFMGGSLDQIVCFPLDLDTLFGKIVVSDTLSGRHFMVDYPEDEPLSVGISMSQYPETSNVLELPNGLWRYTLSGNIRTINLFCLLKLTTPAKRELCFHWFSQGPRILAQIDMGSDDPLPQLIVSQITTRYFQIRVEADPKVNRPPTSDLYLFIGAPFPTDNHQVYVPDVYLSSDPHGAKHGEEHASDNVYTYSVENIAQDVLLHGPVSLDCSTLLHETCGFHPMSLDIAKYLEQSELSIYLIQDEAMKKEIHKSLAGCSSSVVTANFVPREQLKRYTDMLKDLESKYNHDASPGGDLSQSELRIYEVESDGVITPEDTSESSAIRSPISRIFLGIFILGSMIAVLVDSMLIRVTVLIGFYLYARGYRF
ncbi:uncharacterized protein BT62DRAFT_936653 [Guyanagaster necrorhizus]|uniref:Protein kinase domain-containing protein n=1 Tax=Guyanagaster necrorhizus TaxID=856835 RepID=A0A9P7VK38_9AGAR|nr:uncharacterized protein BT62DRAFT_936653 [Guyanagaster necrorhizus MCA 3950]KAG7442000.1 hypothetical protein BT62DRAFT_936653 [Guyanagaster necrorhizus MCA 3950]